MEMSLVIFIFKVKTESDCHTENITGSLKLEANKEQSSTHSLKLWCKTAHYSQACPQPQRAVIRTSSDARGRVANN